MHGPRTKRNLFEVFGMISSFMNSFNPSARGCSIPKGPARFGPRLSCITAATFLSAYVSYIAITSDIDTMLTISISFSSIKAQSIASSPIICLVNFYFRRLLLLRVREFQKVQSGADSLHSLCGYPSAAVVTGRSLIPAILLLA